MLEAFIIGALLLAAFMYFTSTGLTKSEPNPSSRLCPYKLEAPNMAMHQFGFDPVQMFLAVEHIYHTNDKKRLSEYTVPVFVQDFEDPKCTKIDIQDPSQLLSYAVLEETNHHVICEYRVRLLGSTEIKRNTYRFVLCGEYWKVAYRGTWA